MLVKNKWINRAFTCTKEAAHNHIGEIDPGWPTASWSKAFVLIEGLERQWKQICPKRVRKKAKVYEGRGIEFEKRYSN